MARSSRGLARRAGGNTEAETIAIVCEGQKTEDIYFSGIRREFRLATARLRVISLGADPLHVVQEAQCGCGYDAKGFDFASVWPHHQQALQNATKLDTRQRKNHSEVLDRNPWTSVHELVGKLLQLVEGNG